MSSSVLVKRGRYEVPTSQTKKTVLCPVCNLAAREDYIKHRHLRSLIIWSNEDSNKPARKGTREYDGANAEQRSHTEYCFISGQKDAVYCEVLCTLLSPYICM